MTELEILKELEAILENVLEHNNFTLNRKTTANDVDGWDSITHIMIINEIEERFSFKFKLLDLMNINNIGDLLEITQKEITLKEDV
jgi:acyl carrier protein